MTPKLDELKEAIKIDRYNLDTELERQPSLYLQAAEAAALARSKMDELKYNMEVLEAELDKVLRDEAEGKPTEKSISMELQRHPDLITANREYLRQRLRVEKLDQLKEACRQRNYMLRELAALYISGYYSEAKSTGADRSKVREAKAEYNRERMNELRRKRSD